MEALTHKMPSVEIPSFVKANLKHLVLADSDFDKPGDIDLLLGADIFHSIYNGQRLEVGPGLPVALHSVFGWVITGRLDVECSPPAETSTLLASTAALDNVVKRFWEVEEPPKQTIVNPENEKCEQMYTDLVRRNEDGRYVVPMLLKEEHEQLGDSHRTALSRLHNLEKRFLHHEDLNHDYGEYEREHEVKTVTFGVSSSPFLAIRTLHQLANDHGASWPEAASILRHDTFMDDVTAGAPSVEAALNLKDGIINLLNRVVSRVEIMK
ncbi:uncharacterized protein LOC135119018 [Helicoverpa armigera]|uniref:uncharacterized protein LOC135119018 n=1 Tax=Helicoverpa armigera TaxID=29058 RepID=UPI003083DFB1